MSDLRFQPKQTVVFEGDSATSRRQGPTRSTWAYLRLMNWDRTWADHLEELLFCWCPDLALRFANNASGGAPAKTVAERIDTVVSCKADWVLATTGGNDVRLGIDITEYLNTWRGYAERLQAERGAQLVLLGTWSFPGDCPEKMKRERIAPYWDALSDLAKEVPNLHFLDLSAAITEKAEALRAQWQGHTIFSGPDNHYNEVGARIIAGEVLRAFGILR
jgi:hypothetical protein